MDSPNIVVLIIGALIVVAYFGLIAFIVRTAPTRAGRIIIAMATALAALPAVLYALHAA